MQITFETSGGDQLRQHRTLALGRQLGFERDRFEPLLDPALLARFGHVHVLRSEEHTSELQSLMRISYAVFCLKKKKKHTQSYKNSTDKTKNQHKLHNNNKN